MYKCGFFTGWSPKKMTLQAGTDTLVIWRAKAKTQDV